MCAKLSPPLRNDCGKVGEAGRRDYGGMAALSLRGDSDRLGERVGLRSPVCAALLVADQDYIQEARAVDAFDAGHLDVGGGAGAANVGR